MAYTRHTWADGDIISAERLNNLESGVEEAMKAGGSGSGLPAGGTTGQVLTKNSDADNDADWEDPSPGGVASFNGRTGAVTPQSGDYTAEMVGAFQSEVETTAGTKGLYWMEEAGKDGSVTDAYISASTPIEAAEATADYMLATLGQVKALAQPMPDSGWIDLELTEDFVAYGGVALNRYRKIGNIVQVSGSVSPASNDNNLNTINADVLIATLPEGFRPPASMQLVMPGSNKAHWVLSIVNNGKIQCKRYYTGDSYPATPPTTTTWMPFNIMFFVDSETLPASEAEVAAAYSEGVQST